MTDIVLQALLMTVWKIKTTTKILVYSDMQLVCTKCRLNSALRQNLALVDFILCGKLAAEKVTKSEGFHSVRNAKPHS